MLRMVFLVMCLISHCISLYFTVFHCISLYFTVFPLSGSALKVNSLNLMEKKNRESHHTDDFEVDDLIVRRGQSFSIGITFDRNPDVESDVIALLMTTGKYLCWGILTQ